MSENTDQLNELLSRLNSLTRKQEMFAGEISGLREEILKITRSSRPIVSIQPETKIQPEPESMTEEVE